MPLTVWKGRPIYLATMLALAAVICMILTEVLAAASNGAIPERLWFTFAGLLEGRLWTPVTYVLVNPFSIWLLLASYMLWMFGEAVEQHLGRRVFVKLLVGLVLLAPLLLSLVALLGPRHWPAYGITGLEFGVFIAFATLYPRVKLSLIICSVDACVLAMFFVGVPAAIALLQQDWAGFFTLVAQVLFAYGFVRHEQGHWSLPSFSFSRRQPPPPAALPREDASENRTRRRKSRDGFPKEQVDAILEKIHREGLQSLTDEERRIMERASEHLRKGGS